MRVDWGDVPTWVGALTTIGALIAAGWLVKVELGRDRRTTEASARAQQADLVASWNDQVDSDSWAVVRNGSQLPIYDVYVDLFDWSGVEHQYWANFDLVPQIEASTSGRSTRWETNAAQSIWLQATNDLQ
jgi:hypothetical protein